MTPQSPYRRSIRATIPASVWVSGPGPIDPQDRWPRPIISRAVREFSDPGDRVLLVRCPVPATRGPLAAVPADTSAALAVIEGLGRHGWVETGGPGPVRSAELVLASLHPEHTDPVTADAVADLALARLTEGGLLVVLARCGHSPDGVLLDPAGSVVAAAQAADLLYLQHLVAAPVTGTTIPTPQAPPAPDHRAHVVTHSDVFVFLKPRSDAAQ